MAGKGSHANEEPVGWVTIRGVHFPKWADGTIGWQQGEEHIDSKTTTKEAEKLSGVNRGSEHTHSMATPQQKFEKYTYAEHQAMRNWHENRFQSKEDALDAYRKGDMSSTDYYKEHKTASKNTNKITPTRLEAFKENSRQMVDALKEGERQNALEVHYTHMTGQTTKHYWNGVKFDTDKVKQDMAKKYGKKSGVYKAKFKKPKEWK